MNLCGRCWMMSATTRCELSLMIRMPRIRGSTAKRRTTIRRKTVRGGSTNTRALETAIETDTVKNMMAEIKNANPGSSKIQMATVLFNYLATTRYLLRSIRFRTVVMQKMEEFRSKARRFEVSRDFYESIDRLQRHIDRL